jgi:hypothetical protein
MAAGLISSAFFTGNPRAPFARYEEAHTAMFELRAWCIGLAVLLSAAGVLVAGGAPALSQDIDDPAVITQRWFERNDLDKNGYLTAAEVASGSDKQLRRVDIDGDGNISLDEYRYGLPADRPNQSAWLEAQFEHMDLDSDGSVSAAEFIGYGAQLVGDSDDDEDGMVSLEEYSAVMLQ